MMEIDTDMSAEVLTNIGGLSPFQELSADTCDAMAKYFLDAWCGYKIAD
jgi:hypothetical protein